MKEDEFVKMVKDMRAAQVKYFTRGRQYADLNESKRLEKMVDNYIATYKHQQ